MAWFGGIRSKIKSGLNKAREKVTNVWNKYTGKDKFIEADKLYKEITARYNSKKLAYDDDVNALISEIDVSVKSINGYKKKIKSELFIEMAEKLSKLKDIDIAEGFSVEAFINTDATYDTVRKREELFLIDFNKKKVKVFFQSLIGFYTRKKAKETLLAVKEEEIKIDAEIKKMDLEVKRLRAINQSLKNVNAYFEGLIKIYERLLMMLDNSVNTLYFMSMSVVRKLVRKEMSIRKLPLTNQKEIEAIMTISRILKEMVDIQLVSVQEEKEVSIYEVELEENYNQIQEINKVA